MFMTKLRLTALVVLLAGLLATGGALTLHALEAAPPREEGRKTVVPAADRARPGDEKRPAVRVTRPRRGGVV